VCQFLILRKEKDRDRDRDRDSYRPTSSFAEKKDYHPDVKVEYVDDFGRMLDPKEVCISCHTWYLLLIYVYIIVRLSGICHTSFMGRAQVERKLRNVLRSYKKNL